MTSAFEYVTHRFVPFCYLVTDVLRHLLRMLNSAVATLMLVAVGAFGLLR